MGVFGGGFYRVPGTDKPLDIFRQILYFNPLAEVVELADALRSGRSVLKDVGVQLPPSAPEVISLFKDHLFNK